MFEFNAGKYSLAIVAAVVAMFSVFTATAANASTSSYDSLSHMRIREAKQPRTRIGVQQLSQSEDQYRERLPIQLEGAIKRISNQKYKPSNKRRG